MATKSTKKAAPKKAAAKKTTKRTTKKTTAKRTPKPKTTTKAKAMKASAAPKEDAPARERDPRLPVPGTVLTRTFKGTEIRVEVLESGFAYDGKTWRSLSGIAKAVSGTPWNGYLFFNLQPRAAAKKDGAA